MESQTQQPAATPAAFVFEGETYTLPASTLPLEQLVGEIQAHLLARQKAPWDVLNDATKHIKDEATLRLVAAEAYADMKRGERIVTPMEALTWLEGPSGLAWLMWRLLHEKYPKLTLEAAGKLVDTLGIKAARDIQKDRVT